jgi:hypothetical protein
MSSVGTFKALCLCGILVGSCVGQKANSPAGKPDIRPAIFQRGPQAVEVVASPSVSNAQLSNANFHRASDEEVNGMEQTLEQYVVAFESLDLSRVKQVWPDLDSKHMKAFKNVFESFKGASAAPRLGLQCSIPKVTDGVANVECLETVVYSVGKGKTKEAGPAKVEIQLKGQSSRWVMQDMKGTG